MKRLARARQIPPIIENHRRSRHIFQKFENCLFRSQRLHRYARILFDTLQEAPDRLFRKKGEYFYKEWKSSDQNLRSHFDQEPNLNGFEAHSECARVETN